MQFRCRSCQAAVWIQKTVRTKNRAIVKCHTCPQEYDLGSILERADPADLHRDALALAKGSEIDLPAAYSVLLGILTANEARDGSDPSLCASDDRADRGADVSFDPAFADAIKAGDLTPAQAMKRGNRRAFAENLVTRHRLPVEQALAVADNQIPLLTAIRTRKTEARIHVDPEHPRKSRTPVIIAAAAILLVAIFFALPRSPDEAGGSEARTGSSKTELTTVEVKVNRNGEPTEVAGQDPESVLAAFCESATSGEPVPVGLEAANDGWTGLYRQDDSLYALRMRRDSLRDLWVVGNGVEPIEAERSVRTQEPEDTVAQRLRAAPERIVVERNARGAVLRVSAADPAIVLLAYCQVHAGGSGCEPLELRSGNPAEAELRLGIFRDFSEQLMRITIRRGGHTQKRWTAGDGSGLIEVALAGESPPGIFATPISQ